MNDLTTITATVASIDPQTPFHEVVSTIETIIGMKQRLTALQKEAEAVAVEQLRASGPIVLGAFKYYAGPTKRQKCPNVPETAEALSVATGGDWESFCDCLASDAFKPGACREVLGDEYPKHFETVETWEMKEGKASAKLQKMNLAFVK